MKRRSILILSWRDLKHPRAGGSEVYVQNVAREWAAQGHRVVMFASATDGAPGQEDADGYSIVRGGGRLSVYAAARKWYLRRDESEFDLVLDVVNTRPFMTPHFVPPGKGVALIHQVCREVWFHETPMPVAVAGRYVLEPHWLRSYRNWPVLTLSRSSKESLREYGISQAQVVYVGNDAVSPARAAKERDPTVIFVGRLAANKRPHHALQAHAELRKSLPEARLWMVGGGPLYEKLASQTVPGAQFFGRVSQELKHDLMARAHVLVATSVREGWGMIVSEAASLGTVAAGYDVAGLRDSIVGAGGYLSRPDPQALAAVLVRAIEEQRSPSLSEHVRSWSEVADDVLAKALSAVSSRL